MAKEEAEDVQRGQSGAPVVVFQEAFVVCGVWWGGDVWFMVVW